MNTDMRKLFEDCPVVAAVKSGDGLERCLAGEVRVVFVLYGKVTGIADIVRRLKAAGKTVFVHIDLIEGLSSRDAAVEFIAQFTDADGIISTRAPQIACAHELGLGTVQRFFLLDSLSLENLKKSDLSHTADCFEVLPGVMPKILRELCTTVSRPVIAGGLIRDKQDVIAALGAGAIAISTTNPDIWVM